MSTDEVYGDVDINENIKSENSLLMPTNPYAATKAAAEMFLNAYFKSFQIPYIIVRCNNIYGPRQYPEKVIPSFIYNLLNNTECLIHGQGETERHFIYISDAVEALITIWKYGKLNNIYNIASKDEPIKIIELARLLINKLKGDISDYKTYIKIY